MWRKSVYARAAELGLAVSSPWCIFSVFASTTTARSSRTCEPQVTQLRRHSRFWWCYPMPQLTQTVLQMFKAIHLPKILRLGFLGGNILENTGSCPFWRRKEILSIYRAWILNWETWAMFIIMFITFGSKLDRATFWKEFSFIIPSMLLVLAPLQLEVFPSSLGFFYICFYFKIHDQLRVIIICCVLKVFLPVRIRLKIVTFKPLKNNQLVLSTSYADLSAFLHFIQFGQIN